MRDKFWTWPTQYTLRADLACEQLRAVARQIPLLYALLALNAFGLAFTYRHEAPDWLTTWVPGFLVGATIIRMLVWVFWPPQITDSATAVRKLKSITVLGAIFAVTYTAWALKLAEYGDAISQAHVAIFIALTV